ncbi:Tn3 family transposase [Acidibrevibacterium fodinaquatile]|uniref:Tn3 family transposase n=1 Tax=Acidibrevibacterium fodinaquatile TaxID=1969806 RepID=UPI000E0D6988|nr:Tn3 family transposase [Acidibrevibacterium fodinaquatile]
MPRRHILSLQSRAALFDPPTEPAAIVRHYTFSPEDIGLIRHRRRAVNRLGFAVNLAYLKFPGRVLRSDETPPAEMLAYIATQTESEVIEFESYAKREETRWEHLGELEAYLNVRPFRRDDKRAVAQIAIEYATGSDRGDVIVAPMVEYLRERRILLPAAVTLEKVALAARALARKRAYKNLGEGLSPESIAGLESLLVVARGEERTSFAWLRDWPEAPRQKNLLAVVERLEAVRKLGVGPDREKRIHRARYATIAKEISIFVPRDITRFDAPRRLATLIIFAREMEAALTDAALAMFDKMLGAVFRRADRTHKDKLIDRAKSLDASARALLGMAKAMLEAKAKNQDQVAAVERALGWERLKALVAATETVVIDARPDNLGEVVERYVSIRRMSPVVLGAFAFRSWKENDPLLAALDVVRELHASGANKLPPRTPTGFLRPAWRKVVKAEAGLNRRAYEVAAMMSLRDRLRSGDVWVEGSRAFRAFDDFLLPRDAFKNRRSAGELDLAVPDSFEAWRDTKTRLLEMRLGEIDALAAAGELPEASLTQEGLSISAIRGSENEAADALVRRLYAMLPRLRVTELFAEVHGWTGFADRFAHLRTGVPPDDARALMTAVLADATNLGLTRMARSVGAFSHSRLLWVAEWHVREETYQAALACISDAIHAQPLTRLWGDGDTSSSDGQFFRAGGHGQARADYNAKYSSDPGVKFYTHVSDRYAPFHSKVIAANASEAAHVLDGLMHHESSLDIREHYTDTAGAIDHVFGLCQLLGFRFAPRIRDLADRRLYIVGARSTHKSLEPLVGGTVDLRVIAENWDEILRLAASIKAGTVAPSAILRRLAAYPRQNTLAKALKEIGRMERTLFTLDWIGDPALRRRANAGLNKGEAHHALKRAVFFHRLGEIRDRTFENQGYRASGLNLAVAAIILWNTVYLGRAVDELRARGEIIADDLLTHVAPLGWEHVAFNGDYVWPTEPLPNAFRPLRYPRAEFLDAA